MTSDGLATTSRRGEPLTQDQPLEGTLQDLQSLQIRCLQGELGFGPPVTPRRVGSRLPCPPSPGTDPCGCSQLPWPLALETAVPTKAEAGCAARTMPAALKLYTES